MRCGRSGSAAADAEHGLEVREQAVDRLGVEQIRCVSDVCVQGAVGGVAQHQVEVEARPGPSGDREPLELVAADLAPCAGDDVVAEQDLEERRVAPRALRVEHLDELLERQLLVGERAQHGRPHALQQLREGRIAGQVGAQRQRVGEEAEQLRRLLVMSTGDRRADHEIVGAAVAMQERLERGRQHHEQRDAAARASSRSGATTSGGMSSSFQAPR